MRKSRGVLITLVLTVITLAAMPTIAQAAPSQPGGKYCAMLLGGARDAQGNNEVLAEACSDVSDAAARQALVSSSSSPSTEAAAAASVVLMYWYADSYYGGSYTIIYGEDGYCDYTGYDVTPSWWWQNNLSSIKGANLCNNVYLTKRSTYALARYCLPLGYLGTFNDNVALVEIMRRDYCPFP